MKSRDPMQEVVRVETVRKLTYQGPRGWVRNTLNRALKGTVEMQAPGAEQALVISEELERSRELSPAPETPDTTILQHRAQMYGRNGRNRGPKTETKG